MGGKVKITDKNIEEIDVRFKPRARLLKQLGDQLIKNESIALIELVKNSYDADSSKVTIYMENVDTQDEDGIIIIEDDGEGMSLDIVKNVWMEPGSDFKLKQIENKVTTKKYNRLPIGEKGIGRFGVHKLGDVIEMVTKMKNKPEVFIKIDWGTLDKHTYLEDVPVKIFKRKVPQHFKNGATGTNIVISKLRNEWKRGIARTVKRSINSLTSPFESNDSFKAEFEILDKPGWFKGILSWDKIKEYALNSFDIEIEGNSISKFNYNFTPWDTMSKIESRELTIKDKLVYEFSKLDNSLEQHNIGKIKFKGYIFNRDAFVLKLGLQLEKTSFNKYFKKNGGVKVFRDTLRVYDYGEPENDWLDLNIRRVNQPTKRISKNLIVGAVYLDRESSSDLEEKTNREGFIENDAYQSFKQAIIHSIELIENFRYQDKKKLREIYGPTKKSEPVLYLLKDLKKYVEKKITDNEIKSTIVKYLVKIEADYLKINENLLKAAGAGLSLSVIIHEVEKIIVEILKVVKKEKSSERVYKLVRHLSSLIEGYTQIIQKSTRTNENVTELVEQSLFNVEYRLSTHSISVVKKYLKRKQKIKVKLAKSLFIGSLMNLFDNSIFWLEKAGRKNKKIFIDILEYKTNLVEIIIADNGTGFLLPTNEITEPFISGKPDGIGLGLHIASEVMLAQSGRLWFPEPNDFDLPDEFVNGAIIALEFKIDK